MMWWNPFQMPIMAIFSPNCQKSCVCLFIVLTCVKFQALRVDSFPKSSIYKITWVTEIMWVA